MSLDVIVRWHWTCSFAPRILIISLKRSAKEIRLNSEDFLFLKKGSYLLVWESDHDCDSFNLLTLTVFEENVTEFELEVCEPGIYEVNGKNYLAPGTYTETNTNQEGCDSIIQVSLFLGDGPVLANSWITPDNGLMSGAIMVEIEGGVPPYWYEWNTPDSSNQISNLAAGQYDLTVTDAYDCSASFSFEVKLTSSNHSLPQPRAFCFSLIRFLHKPLVTWKSLPGSAE
jgi:hypothetical protein